MYSHSSCVKINPYKNSTIAYTNKQKFRSSDTLPKSIKIYGENFSHKNNNTNYDSCSQIITEITMYGRFNDIPNIVKNAKNLKKITFIYVTEINWDSVFNTLANKDRLEYMSINGGNMIYIPNSIGMLSQIDSLILINLNLISLPDSLEMINNLTFLKITGTQIANLPFYSKNYTLKHLDISGNNFNGLPNNLINLHNLETFVFSDNIFYSNDETLLVKNEKLKKIYLDGCGLEIFPISLKHLNNLAELSLAENRISKIPKEVVDFKNLIFLDLTNYYGNSNDIKKVREKMPNCKIWAPIKSGNFEIIDVFF